MPMLSRHRKNKEEMRDDVTTGEVSKAIDDWIFSERDRKILKRRLIDGICFEPLAEEFDLSVRRIQSIVYKGEEIVFRHL